MQNQDRLTRLEALHREHIRAGRIRAADSARAFARRHCAEHDITPPEWCALKRGAEPTPAPPATLAATIVAQTGPVALPRYGSLRAWARAQSGSRVICWHAEGRVSLVWIATDQDRKRSQTFASEAAALEAIATGSIVWAKPRKPKPNLSAGGRKRQPLAALGQGRA